MADAVSSSLTGEIRAGSSPAVANNLWGIFMKPCIVDGCTEIATVGRYCREHYLQRKREKAKEHYATNGHYSYKKTCCCCGKDFDSWSKDGIFCSRACYNQYNKAICKEATNNYERAHGENYSFMHRRIAENLLQTKLGENIVVHHLDWCPTNNEPSNLLVLHRSMHAKLHKYILSEMATRYGSAPLHDRNMMEAYRDALTHEWLDTAGASFILLSKLDNTTSQTLKQLLDMAQ